MNRMKKIIVVLFIVIGIALISIACGENSGWTIEDGRLYYYYEDGSKAVGDIRIGRILYSFASDGHLKHTGSTNYTSLGNVVYVDDNDNLAIGWINIGEDKYYFGTDYYAANGLTVIDNKTYLFSDGKLLNTPGWNGCYYIDKNGELDLTPGYRKIEDEGIWYFFDDSGCSVNGFIEINGEIHYFSNGPGAPSASKGGHPERRGWTNTPWYYYFDLQTGVMKTGDQIIDGFSYHFYDDGVLQVQNDIAYVDGAFRGFDNNSRPISNGSVTSSDGNTYTFSYGTLVLDKGWTNIRGKWFYREEAGGYEPTVLMPWVYNSETDTYSQYLLNKYGEMVIGWLKVGSNYYLADENGHPYFGWVYKDGIWYYFRLYWEDDKSEGSMVVGWEKIDEEWYYFDKNGAMCTGWQLIDDSWYYFDSTGKMCTGWVSSGNTWYYLDQSGAMLTDKWIEDQGKWYYFNNDGSMQTGWLQIDDKWYLLKASGEMTTGWANSGGVTYFFKESGAMAANEWIEEKSKWYWLDKDGAMATGWKEINEQWEMFDDNGAWLYTWGVN